MFHLDVPKTEHLNGNAPIHFTFAPQAELTLLFDLRTRGI
jgi:hypothetical protein